MCAVDKNAGIWQSGAPSQRKAAAAASGVTVMDLTDAICPDCLRCAPVIGNVLVYRQTTLTNTKTAEPKFSTALAEAIDGRFGARLR